MSLIKDIYSPAFYNSFADTVIKVVPGFNKKQFLSAALDAGFLNREWKQRMQHTTTVLHQFLDKNFAKAAKQIQQIIGQLRQENHSEDHLVYMFFPDYIEKYGLDDFKNGVKALQFVTQFISCEFGIRSFVVKYGDVMMAQMEKWSLHPSAKVRRLSSEGSRPRLPWAMAIPALKKDPAPLLPILENLKNDPSESVRRSVANNLNDIAKDHPDVVIAIAKKWLGQTKETDAIIKHGCRTLLKQGHTEILEHYGLIAKHISVSGLEITTPRVKIGDHVGFQFAITNTGKTAQLVRVEYGIYYQKSKGHLARKVFKISERMLQPGETQQISRKQSFKIITTRVFHTGLHQVSVIVNGEEKGMLPFELMA